MSKVSVQRSAGGLRRVVAGLGAARSSPRQDPKLTTTVALCPLAVAIAPMPCEQCGLASPSAWSAEKPLTPSKAAIRSSNTVLVGFAILA